MTRASPTWDSFFSNAKKTTLIMKGNPYPILVTIPQEEIMENLNNTYEELTTEISSPEIGGNTVTDLTNCGLDNYDVVGNESSTGKTLLKTGLVVGGALAAAYGLFKAWGNRAKSPAEKLQRQNDKLAAKKQAELDKLSKKYGTSFVEVQPSVYKDEESE